MKRTKFFALAGVLALTLALAAPVQASNAFPLAQAPSALPPVQGETARPIGSNTAAAIIPSFPITVNGHVIDNNSARYPIFVYQDVAYVPMTYHFARFLGVITYWDAETNTFYLRASSKQGEYVPDTGYTHSGNILPISKISCDLSVNGNKRPAQVYQDLQYPYLVYDGVVYLPLDFSNRQVFKWDWSWDQESGLVLDFKRDVTQSFLEWETTFAGTPLE